MASPLIGGGDCQEIREVIDVTLTADELPNEQIMRDAFMGQAIRYVLGRDADAETRTGDEGAKVRLAAIYYTAGLLCPTIPILTAVRAGNESVQRQAIDMQARAAELKGLASSVLDDLLTPTTRSMPFSFGTVPGYRGR